MNVSKIMSVLRDWDAQGRVVFDRYDFEKLFPDERRQTLQSALNRLVQRGVLVRPCRGIYVNEYGHAMSPFILEQVARSLRRGHYSYISLESALSEYGVISQILVDRLTVMTTGRAGVFETKYGVIEYTHTKRSAENILKTKLW